MATAAVAATLLIVAALYASLSSLASSRLAHVSMKGPLLKVEVLDQDEQAAVATFTAPTQQPQTIPPGHYHVRLSSDGQLSETSLFDADKGGHYDLSVWLAQREFFEIPVQNAESHELARIDAHDDVFLAAANQLRRFDGATGQPVWQTSLTANDQPLVAKALSAATSSTSTLLGPSYAGADIIPPCLVRPLVDLDGDGTPDLVWASRSTASLVAVSGKSGKVLWCHRSQTTLPEGLDEKNIQAHFINFMETVVGQPLMAEIGGRKIVVAMCFVQGEQYVTKNDMKWINSPAQLWLDAVDATTGETVWRRSLSLSGVFPEPATSKPDVGAKQNSKTATISYLPDQTLTTAAVGTIHGRKIGAIAYGQRLFGFDFLTGQPAWPDRQLDDKPPVVVRFADLVGDGQLDVLMVREGAANNNYNPDGQARELSLVVLSPQSDKPLWEIPLPGVNEPPKPNARAEPQFDWPLVTDLDGKGKPAVVIPFVDYAAGVCGVEALDAADGKSRWRQPLSSAVKNWRAPQPDRIVVGPDLDGDGFHELFAASRDEQTYRVFVDALSGRDGRRLWIYTRSGVSTTPFGGNLLPLRWWQTGADGWPMLVVTGAIDQFTPENKQWSVVLAASSGRIVHDLDNFGAPQIADLNGDGLPDLFAPRQCLQSVATVRGRHTARDQRNSARSLADVEQRRFHTIAGFEWRWL